MKIDTKAKFGSHNPQGIALDGKGNVCVADADNDRIQKFNPDEMFLQTFGT
jgi:sugar lactone lactonase YvrE